MGRCGRWLWRFADGTLTRVKNGGRTLIKISELEGSLEERKLCALELCTTVDFRMREVLGALTGWVAPRLIRRWAPASL